MHRREPRRRTHPARPLGVRTGVAALAGAAVLGMLVGCAPQTDGPTADVVTAESRMPLTVAAPPAAADTTALEAARTGSEAPVAVRTLADPAWVARTAEAAGIPARALAAYAGAVLLTGAQDPGCGLDWPTLAGIGSVESRHGTIDGSAFGDDGRAGVPIWGPRLDGTRFDAVPDTDGGALDADDVFDRAMGPMQIIPDTWRIWGADGGGGADPQSIDDAALTAARYLCHSGGDLTTVDGWRAAIAGYNTATSYAGLVAEDAGAYAAAAD